MAQSNLIDIEIISDNENFKIIGSEKKSVLDVALDNNIDAPYSCQGGICSTCLARIKKGTVKMETNQILTLEVSSLEEKLAQSEKLKSTLSELFGSILKN